MTIRLVWAEVRPGDVCVWWWGPLALLQRQPALLGPRGGFSILDDPCPRQLKKLSSPSGGWRLALRPVSFTAASPLP